MCPRSRSASFRARAARSVCQRLVGLENALRIILDAKPVDAAKARDMGLIDEIIGDEFTSGAL